MHWEVKKSLVLHLWLLSLILWSASTRFSQSQGHYCRKLTHKKRNKKGSTNLMIALLPSWDFPRGPEVWWLSWSGAPCTGVNLWKTKLVDYQAKLNCVHQRQANLSHKTCEAGCFQGHLEDQRHLNEIIYIHQKVFLNLVERENSVHQGNVPQAVHSIWVGSLPLGKAIRLTTFHFHCLSLIICRLWNVIIWLFSCSFQGLALSIILAIFC